MNLPKKNGRKVLVEIKHSPTPKGIPIVILTNSTSDADILRKDGVDAEYYITKPVTFDRFLNVVKSVRRQQQR
jgi:DNA-binding response OmpR family regulator